MARGLRVQTQAPHHTGSSSVAPTEGCITATTGLYMRLDTLLHEGPTEAEPSCRHCFLPPPYPYGAFRTREMIA